MDTLWSVKAKDEAGIHAFYLIHKSTGQEFRLGRAEIGKVTLGPYHPDDLNDALQELQPPWYQLHREPATCVCPLGVSKELRSRWYQLHREPASAS